MLHRLLSSLLGLLVPPLCATCRGPLGGTPGPLCGSCRAALPWLRDPRCGRCAQPPPCRPCPAAGAAWDRAWAPLAHEGPASAAVAALKFRGALPLADWMAATIAAAAPADLLAGAALVPVPLHPARRRARGFDQTAALGSALARRSGLVLAPCLRRAGTPARQLGAQRGARLAAGRIDVRVVRPPPRRAVLLDDVHTTGATLDACARALRTGGSREVACVTFARALRRC